MIATESTVMKRTMNLVFLGVVATAAALFVFRAELTEAAFDALANNEAAAKLKWSPDAGGKFVLRPERNDTLFLQVGALRSGAATSLGVPVSFDLTNLGDANDFPNIAVVMVGAGGQPLRQVVFSPKEYTHQARFEKQHVELMLQPRPGERSFTVRVFYGEQP
jgi:hypothetical protein